MIISKINMNYINFIVCFWFIELGAIYCLDKHEPQFYQLLHNLTKYVKVSGMYLVIFAFI